MRILYFDNAATSWPKPQSVIKAMKDYFYQCGGNPGRSGHRRAIEAGRILLKTRESIAKLFNVRDPSHIVFTKNATEALNLIIYGVLKGGDHVVTTSMEHNSVMRPLSHLEGRGVSVSVVEADSKGVVKPESFIGAVRENTKMMIVTHASNVTGTINDIEAIGRLCGARKIPFAVDAAQTAGVVPIDVEKYMVDFLAFSGHKGLLGPQGTGGLFIRDERFIEPLMRGGTGSLSDREVQPDFLPDRYESGTLNVIGITGLCEGVRFVLEKGVDQIRRHESHLMEVFLNGIGSLKGIVQYGVCNPGEQVGVLSINIKDRSSSGVGELLEKRYGIMTRIGLHCAPRAHKTLGTFPDGTVRFSWGIFTKEKDISVCLRALKELVSRNIK